MKKISLFSMSAVLAIASIGCSTATNTNTNTSTNARVNTNVAASSNANSTIVVTNTNNMETGTMNTNTTTGNYNANITRAEYDKEKDRYAQEAKSAGRTIGSGVNDGWLWTKTRASLATTADLRDSTINVDVSNDVVTLTGTVANAAQKAKAEQVAKAIEGVKSVTNNLKVSAGDSLTNQMTDGEKSTGTNTNKK